MEATIEENPTEEWKTVLYNNAVYNRVYPTDLVNVNVPLLLNKTNKEERLAPHCKIVPGTFFIEVEGKRMPIASFLIACALQATLNAPRYRQDLGEWAEGTPTV
jgi:broad specificity polyphosphatase/5'/3'-nucleotidase SurE